MNERSPKGENKRLALERREKEYQGLRSIMFETVKGYFPKGRNWESKEYEGPKGRTVIIGFDFDKQEATLTVDYKDAQIEESIIYTITPNKVVKEGYVEPQAKDDFPIYYTDDEDLKNDLLVSHPDFAVERSLKVGIEELRMLSRLVRNPELNTYLSAQIYLPQI
jgi:hypothetical protein